MAYLHAQQCKILSVLLEEYTGPKASPWSPAIGPGKELPHLLQPPVPCARLYHSKLVRRPFCLRLGVWLCGLDTLRYSVLHLTCPCDISPGCAISYGHILYSSNVWLDIWWRIVKSQLRSRCKPKLTFHNCCSDAGGKRLEQKNSDISAFLLQVQTKTKRPALILAFRGTEPLKNVNVCSYSFPYLPSQQKSFLMNICALHNEVIAIYQTI